MYTREQFRRQVGVIDLSRITANAPGSMLGWWRYGDDLVCFGNTDVECRIGVIIRAMPGASYPVYGCWAPGNPPIDDNCIIFTDRDGRSVTTQDDDVCGLALSKLPRGSGKSDGITIVPSASSVGMCNSCGTVPTQAPLPQRILFLGFGVIIVGTLAYGIYKVLTLK
jgi:hypothetical protein